MNFDAFSHGQIHSKLWLCEELERYTKVNSRIWILGSWYNLLAFMLHIRKPDYYSSIIGYDIDYHSKEVSDKLCNAWTIYNPISVQNIIANANELDWSNPPDIVINCSVEHFSDNTWFDSDGYVGTYSVPNQTSIQEITTNATGGSRTINYTIKSSTMVGLDVEYTLGNTTYRLVYAQ